MQRDAVRQSRSRAGGRSGGAAERVRCVMYLGQFPRYLHTPEHLRVEGTVAFVLVCLVLVWVSFGSWGHALIDDEVQVELRGRPRHIVYYAGNFTAHACLKAHSERCKVPLHASWATMNIGAHAIGQRIAVNKSGAHAQLIRSEHVNKRRRLSNQQTDPRAPVGVYGRQGKIFQTPEECNVFKGYVIRDKVGE